MRFLGYEVLGYEVVRLCGCEVTRTIRRALYFICCALSSVPFANLG